ncbi:MAG: hypothetical protein J0M08_03655 [Bacteroidetes bacterium]|nr:hypothetical protein [Bacteroidota bacterium]
MSKSIILVISTFLLLSLKSDNTFQLKSNFNYQDISYFEADYLNNIYLLSNNIVQKRDINGNVMRTFNNKNLGNIFSIDASNPLKNLIFYKEFRTILFLDNTLTLNGGPYLLDDSGIHQPLLACSSFNNSIWVYDQQNFELVRLSVDLKITHRTGNIVQLTQVRNINPNFMVEYNNLLYLNDPAQGIFVFDIFGTYKKLIPIKISNHFQITEDYVLFCKNDSLWSYNFTSFDKTFLTTDTALIKVKKTKDYLITFSKNQAKTYYIK